MIRALHLVGPALGAAAVVTVLSACSLTDVGQPAASTTTPSAVAAASGSGSKPSGRASAGPAASASGGSAKASPSSTTPRPRPPDVPSVSGYVFGDAPPAVAAGVQRLADASPDVFGSPAVRGVRRGNVVLGTLALIGLSPAYVGQPKVEAGLVDGLVTGMAGSGYRLSSNALHGRRVVVATAKGSTIVAWYDAGVVALFLSDQPQDGPVAFADDFLGR